MTPQSLRLSWLGVCALERRESKESMESRERERRGREGERGRQGGTWGRRAQITAAWGKTKTEGRGGGAERKEQRLGFGIFVKCHQEPCFI